MRGPLARLLAPVLIALAAAPLGAADLTLDNGIVKVAFPVQQGRLGDARVTDVVTGQSAALGPGQVWLDWTGGGRLSLADFAVSGVPQVEALPVAPDGTRASSRLKGRAVVAHYLDALHHLGLTWRAQLREGSRYVRLELDLTNAGPGDQPVAAVGLLYQAMDGAAVAGDVNGSPVVAGTRFLGVEHPLARNTVSGGRVRGLLPRMEALKAGEAEHLGAVVGFTDAGQMRRGFLAYLERERARPYRQFLHHNTWYNIGYFTRFSEADELGVIAAFDQELVQARGVTMDGFVLDDGWDNPASLWRFNPTFPKGLGPVAERARAAGASMGLWLSPWGGYGKPKRQRLEAAAAEGFETREGSFSLAGPRYYARFRALCTDVVRQNHVAYFKFDGIGSQDGPDKVDPAAGRDFEAMMRLIGELRSLSPNLYINQTTGTWASPFWLLTVDSIWRGGDDHDFAGVGSFRQRWITYRDSDTYASIVRRGPLYPLNSLMIHGIIFGAHAKNLMADPDGDFTSEVRSYFGTGTQLQELYVSPELLSKRNWDDLAAAARWSRAHEATLKDTHWVGGDPSKGEVYGWAAWSPATALLTLRNPGDKPAAIEIDAGAVFELPAGAARVFAVTSPYADRPAPVARFEAGSPVRIELAPFEVLVLEATPVQRP